MKLTSLLLIISIFTVQANSLAQKTKVDLNANQLPLQNVLKKIEKKTDFKFLYNHEEVDVKKLVTIHVKQRSLKDVLIALFEDTDIKYVINKKQIILRKESFPNKNSSQSREQSSIQGAVTDPSGLPLLGVTVKIQGKNIGTTTNSQGEFTIQANINEVLVFSYIGFKSKEVTVDTNAFMNVELEEDIQSIDEVVLVGYGEVKKENLTGAVSNVNMKSFSNQAPTVNVEQALQGQVAGVSVNTPNGQPGAATKIRIRGTSSLSGSNQPLFVIDGVPVVPESNIPTGGAEGQRLGDQLNIQGLSTPIANINPNDIESISVLKDASSAAIYGSRAANGVIIINTKKGSKFNKPTINFDVSTTIQNPQTLDVLNASQFKEVWTQAVTNNNTGDAFSQSVLDGSYFGNEDTDWEEELSPGLSTSTYANLSIRGGGQASQYAISLAALNAESGFKGSNSERYTLNLNLNSDVTSFLRFGTNLQTSFFNQSSLDGELVNRIYTFRPDIPVFDEEGNYAYSEFSLTENPVALGQATNNNETFLLLGSIYSQVDFTKDLNFETRLSVNYNNGNQTSFYPSYTFRGGWFRFTGEGDGYAQNSRSISTVLQWQNTLTYKHTFNAKHNIDAVLGTSFEEIKSSYNKAFGTGFSNDVLNNVSSATVSNGGQAYEQGSGLISYFGRTNYDYNQKYLLTLTARIDGSSKFAVNNKYAFFPAAAAAWRISNEDFLVDSDLVNELKLRASYGLTGQQDFGPYQWRTLYETDDYANNPSVILSQLGNDELKWETTKQLDLGLDFSLFNNVINGGVGYYEKNTEDVIFPVKTPGNTGVTSVLANVGHTENKGFELLLDIGIINKPNFGWNVSLNATRNKNKLKKISEDYKDSDGFIVGFPGLDGGRLREGSPIGLIYGFESTGIFQNQTEIDALNSAAPNGIYQEEFTAPGDLKYKDISGPDGTPDGVINDFDQTIIGNSQPDVFGGFSSTFRYKNFSLAAQFSYSIGNELFWFSQTRAINFTSTYLAENKTLEVLNAWTPENPTSQPRMVYRDPNNNDRASSYYVHDASYLRLNTLNLRFNFPKNVIDNIGFVNSIALYGIAQNLWTYTNYPGANPEGGSVFNDDISGAGRDTNRFPPQKSFTIGLNIGF
ncbi:TonB-dependent receptor [Galbibacter mesophilus]|uniref:TonB-dependent receptor n=1 Tax=Galbibacter mesophilus TaxID=379069 RepID=UPI001F5D1F30|nr:TonB-dependent receptor [Galbibacter mesophilus]MCM5662752.1 TonB-dependent receptor [Galbibacter mesophilus]